MKRFLLIFMLLFSLTCSAQIPAVTLKTIDGTTICTDTLSNNGKPFVVSFFASWCKPCNRELDNIAEVYDEWVEETGMKLYAVSIDEGQNAQKVRPFVNSHQWDFNVLLDPNSDFRRAVGIGMIPHTLIFDSSCHLVSSRSGYQEGSEQHIIDTIKNILEGESKANADTIKTDMEQH